MVHRSRNSHRDKVRAFPFVARLKREDPFRPADIAEWQAAADRIAQGLGWYARQGHVGAWNVKLIGFATPAQAGEMQAWIARSGIETRPSPAKYRGPELSVGRYGEG
jgi:hypothetical protein